MRQEGVKIKISTEKTQGNYEMIQKEIVDETEFGQDIDFYRKRS